MSDTINKQKNLDDVVAVSSKVNMGVLYGAQNVTSQVFKAISATPSSIVFNVVVPSIETILDRRLMIQSTMILKINIQNPIAGDALINYGVTDALAPFPFNQLIQNIQCSINNNNITLQQSDLFDVLLRMQDPEDLARYDGKTPTGLDYLYDYSDGVMMNPYYIDLLSDGEANPSYSLAYYQSAGIRGGQVGERTFTSFNNNILSYDMARIANSSCCHKPRGGYVIDAIFKATSDANAINGTWLNLTDEAAAGYYVKFTVTEPLFLSPFLLGLSSKEDHSGIFSVNALNFTINFSQSANRAWRSARFVNPTTASATAPTYQTKTATLIYVDNNASMFCKFYTPKATMLDNPRCVVPYHEYQIFKTSQQGVLRSALLRTAGDARSYGLVVQTTQPNIASDTSALLVSNNIQLQSIPERLLVFVRRVRDSSLTCCDTDSFLTIRNVCITFNNKSGLLATFNQQQLYDATTRNGGIRNLTWEEFSGMTLSVQGGSSGRFPYLGQYNAVPYSQFSGIGAGTLPGQTPTGLKIVPTTGSIVALRFGTDIQIPEESYAPSSIGQFNLQVTVELINLTKDTWSNYELVVLVENPGVLITDRGSSSTFVGLLTKDSFLQTKDSHDHVTLAYTRHGWRWRIPPRPQRAQMVTQSRYHRCEELLERTRESSDSEYSSENR